jgi:hypothetical protein
MVRPIELVHHHGFAALPQCVIEQHTLPKRNESVLIAMDDQEGRNLLCFVQISNGNRRFYFVRILQNVKPSISIPSGDCASR